MHILQHSSADGPGSEVQLNQLAMVVEKLILKVSLKGHFSIKGCCEFVS